MNVEWFQLAKRRAGVTDAQIATALGIERSGANRVMNGRNGFNPRRAGALAALLKVPVDEVLFHAGIKPDFTPAEADHPPARDASADDGAIAIKRVDLSYAMGDGTNLEDYPEEEDVLFDPGFLRRITRAPAHRLFVARGDGDSMFPTLINDDEVVIDTTQRTLNMQDRIWACAFRGAGMIKRLRVVGDQEVEIRSDNHTVPPQTVSAEDLHIVGRVIWVGRRV